MSNPTGAQHLVDTLAALGVEVVFGLPGVHNLPIWEALAHTGIRVIGVRHEQTAGYAADGYARTTGKLGVAIVTTSESTSFNIFSYDVKCGTCHCAPAWAARSGSVDTRPPTRRGAGAS